MVFNRYHARGIVPDPLRVSKVMVLELRQLARSAGSLIVPVRSSVLRASIGLILKHHIYVSDAMQVATHRDAKCDVFVSCDGELLNVARAEGLRVYNPLKSNSSAHSPSAR